MSVDGELNVIIVELYNTSASIAITDVVIDAVPHQSALHPDHFALKLYTQINTPVSDHLGPGRFLLQSTDGKLLCLHYDVLKLASPVLIAYYNGWLIL